jgi:hypothetical protein
MMRGTRQGLWCIGLMWMTLSVCVSQVRDSPPHETRMGYELYSWPGSSGRWNFCIRLNTNSEATVEQVFDKRTVLRSVAQLKRRISELPAGTQVFWVDRIPSGNGPKATGSESLSYPPAELREEIRGYAKKHQVEVQVLNPILNP